MAIVKVQMYIETNDVAQLKRLLEHHIDYIIDMDTNADIITSIAGVTVSEEVFSEKEDQ